jgi:hypothetical protein
VRRRLRRHLLLRLLCPPPQRIALRPPLHVGVGFGSSWRRDGGGGGGGGAVPELELVCPVRRRRELLADGVQLGLLGVQLGLERLH